MFRKLDIPVHDSDKAVHELLSTGGDALPLMTEHFPEVIDGKKVDRQKLGAIVFEDPEKLKKLESILHPLVREHADKFLGQARARGDKIAVLDIPLLFETGGESRVDYTVCVTAPAFIQKLRVLRRPGMTREKLNAILARQMPDAEKRRRASFVIQNGLSKGFTFKQVKDLVRKFSQA
jgi:dephospho-CoA kinase